MSYKTHDGRYLELIERPGYFGKRRDKKIAAYNDLYGEGGWTIVWTTPWGFMEFNAACRYLYERSYFEYLRNRPEDLTFITSHLEVFDNDISNIDSKCDYMIQEAKSTHIQDIAIRNVLQLLGLEFDKTANEFLEVRGSESRGFAFNPGNVPFFDKKWIIGPSLCPKWAQEGSVEDFWQSNKWIAAYPLKNE